MAAAVTELRERAARDPLTGLGHHATFYAEVPGARAARPAAARVVLLADVDGFKAINDRRGHAAGDDVLRSVAGGAARRSRPATAAPTGSAATSSRCCSSARGDADAWAVGWDLQAQARGALGTTMSIGMAIACPGESDEHLVARADAAMYEVKRRGRDGVLIAPLSRRRARRPRARPSRARARPRGSRRPR